METEEFWKSEAMAQINKGRFGSLAGEKGWNEVYLLCLRRQVYDWLEKIDARMAQVDREHP
jgi:hypothetical protein